MKKKTRSEEMHDENIKRTEFRREARSLNIHSPFRQTQYIEARLKGWSIDEANEHQKTKKARG